MKSFEELARAAFLAYEKSVRQRPQSLREWELLHSEIKQHWLAVAKELAAQLANIH